MGRVRIAAFLVLAMVLSVVVMAVPPLVSPASGQAAACSAVTFAELDACVVQYNSALAGTATTIDIQADILYPALLTEIDNATDAALFIAGNGYILNAGGFRDVIVTTDGDVSISNVTLTGSAESGVFAGIYATGGVTVIENSTITGNGKGVWAAGGDVTMRKSTIADNTVGGTGSDAVYVSNAASSMVVEGSTIVGNSGFGLERAFGSLTISGSLVAGNNSCSGTISDLGGNVVDDLACGAAVTPGIAGTYGGLQPNFCFVAACTPTISLLWGSPAIDRDTGCSAGLTDQNGRDRTAGKCDAGAFELGDCATSFAVSNESELAAALHCYRAAASGTTLEITVGASFTLGSRAEIENPAIPPATLVFDGDGHTITSDSGFNGFIQYAGDLQMNNLIATSFANVVVIQSGDATITGSTFTQNGYGVYVSTPGATGAAVKIIDSTLHDNALDGVDLSMNAASSVEIIRSTITNNGQAGVDLPEAGTIEITGSLIAGNADAGCEPGVIAPTGTGNAISDDTCFGIGSATAGLAGTFGSLIDNGCVSGMCTPTVALLAGSPAVDANTGCGAGLVDQRGESRTAGNCDAGAFELGDLDSDGDGFEGPLGDGTDCDDTKASVNPAAAELPYNGVDEDCLNGDLVDVDLDGFDASAATGSTPDCDDTKAGVNPDATDVPGNGVDEDCDGSDSTVATSATCVNRAITVDLNAFPAQVPTEGPDVILGTPGDDVIDALGGDDFICSGGGNDTVNAGAGNDYVRAGAGDDIVNGGDGDDRLFGVTGDDTMNGGPGVDTLHGNKGKDTLDGGGGDDRVFGYADDDTLFGGDGNDKIFGHFGNDIINGGNGDDRLFGWGDQDTINGGLGDDLIVGNFGDDILNGGQGNDTLWGADGDDQVNGNAGDDFVNGNSLNDILTGGPGVDILDGGIGIDSCNGGPDLDTSTRCETIVNVP